jgi:hypothetical protein
MSRKTTAQPFSRLVAQFLVVFLVSFVAALSGCGGDGKNKKSQNPVPILSSIAPTSATVGGPALTLTVNGLNFVSGSTVQWNNSARSTTYVSGTQLTAAIPAGDLVAVGNAQVSVVNPAPGGGTSSAITFTIQNAIPVVSSLSPSSAVAGGPAFDLAVNGSGFVSGATVQWNGASRPTAFVSSGSLKAAIAVADVAAAGTAQVNVVNPPPGGGTSAALTFTIQNTGPILTSLSPASIQAGSPGLNLVVTGSGFVQGATVQWAGKDRKTTFLSATQVAAEVLPMDVAGPGSYSVVVRNPEPSVGPSNALQFVVTSVPTPAGGYPVQVSVATDGSSPNGPSVNGGMDWEGNFIVYASRASNLVAGDTNEAYDLFLAVTCNYVQGACTRSTRRLVMAVDGSQPNGNSGWTAAYPENSLVVSFNGRFAAFVSSASNLVEGDTNTVDDVFLVDTCLARGRPCTPGTVRVSIRADGSQSTWPSSQPAVADDGRYVFFVSADPAMVAGDGNGTADLFMRDTCLGADSACTPSTTRVSLAANGTDANGPSGEPAFTGRYVAFSSAASNLVASDSNGVADIFLRDTCIGATGGCIPTTELVSIGRNGESADGPSSDPQVGPPMAASDGYDRHGRFVAFVSSATNLVAGDTNGAADVFERDNCRGYPACTPSTSRVSVTSSGEQISGASRNPDFLRWDGETIPFVTAASGVVPEDTNGVADVFVRHLCPIGAPTYCLATTMRASVGVGGVEANGASFAPRLCHDPWGAWAVTFVSEATNLLSGSLPAPAYGSIYLTTRQ